MTAVLALKPMNWHGRERLAKTRELKHLDKLVHALLRETGLAASAWGPEELTRVMQAPSLKLYRLAVVDGRRAHAPIQYGRGPTLISIYYADNHYDAISKLPAILGKSYVASIV